MGLIRHFRISDFGYTYVVPKSEIRNYYRDLRKRGKKC